MSETVDPSPPAPEVASVGVTRTIDAADVERTHLLPIYTNTFDRYFISVVVFVAVHLLWMRFFEGFAPLWIATIISLILGVIIVRRG